MLKNELKKIFLKRGFLFVVLFLLILEIGCSLISLNEIFETKKDKEKYIDFISIYEGVVSEEKKERIEMENELYSNANQNKETLKIELENGSISLEEFNERSMQITEYLAGKEVFEVFYEECEYAFSDSANRQIINTKICNWLFGKEKLDLFYVITIIICVLISVIAENESNFISIKNTCKKGNEKLYYLDLNICYFYAGGVSLLLSLIRLFLALSYCGKVNFSASLQSLALFENSEYDISLFQGFLIISMLKMLGGVAFSALCVIAGYYVKSSLNVLFFSLFVAIIPPYVFSSPILYYIAPVSLLISNGYFFGDVVVSGNDVGGTIVYSTSVSIVALFLSVIFALCLIISSYKTNRRWIK